MGVISECMDNAELSVITFAAASHPNDQCGANGLPLTPNSIRILGLFQKVKSQKHPRLCRYIDIERGKHERLMVVSEFHQRNLKKDARTFKGESEKLLIVAYEVLEGLSHLNDQGIVHRSLTPECIQFDKQGHVKLAGYGLYHMTDQGTSVAFPIGSPAYLSPEVLAHGPSLIKEHGFTESVPKPYSSPKCDVWSLGIILLETFFGIRLWYQKSLSELLKKTLEFTKSDVEPFKHIIDEHNLGLKLQSMPQNLQDFIQNCLTGSVSKRSSPKQLLQHQVFCRHQNVIKTPYIDLLYPFSAKLRCEELEMPKEGDFEDEHEEPIRRRPLEEVYYLWQRAGGDLESILRKAELLKAKPPVTILPHFVIEDGETFGQSRDSSDLLDETVILLNLDQLRQRLKDIPEEAYYPLLEDENSIQGNMQAGPEQNSEETSETSRLPLVIKEKDVEYQFHRIILFSRLLKGYPFKRPHLLKEARVDIPPLVRGHVWAALLEVEGDVQEQYDRIDKETPTATDRQIEVDIPRCHQYNELLSSPAGHAKLKRILKAWVISNPQYVYWQGLDSLCAPFLYLNFNDEALAYACLAKFIPKYLHNFFLKDNSAVIQEYLAVFSNLIAFHDPELFNHLDEIGFIPDLYSIPWFLTMYAHVFPLHKIVHLWDTLLLGNSSFPLCIGVAILKQLKDRLLTFGFNECILLFSDMPEIAIDTCVQESIKIFCMTPKSSLYRQHAKQPAKPEPVMSRPNISYYSTDYHDQPQNELSLDPIPLEELKSERCPRISAEDLIELGELKGPAQTKSPTKRSREGKPKLLMIDVRSEEDYLRGAVGGSINIPHSTAFSADGSLVPCSALNKLNSCRNLVKVIIGNKGRTASNFAGDLVRLGYSKVCVLYKGIDVLRPTGLLVVPSTDLR
ncbi:TBC domain-containing protein kinase-like protein [Lingula anatina]|uniref:TBC domain-containing protein kinase-like protein n=1 Tax=Lingula anatina TaxID=7574 RepID=A0A1S3HVG2_LINAN|nr:TBC domain-containing protein kinase-like protein [Lingula anatina]|eukprot:XP_013390013.1 TBC domain-containing protein kinase-like protein [Lingula anatina]